MADRDSERGQPATFDRRTGAVHGSGAGAGGGNPGEDHDDDPHAGGGASQGKGHPLPASDEARHDEIPEHLERDKGAGDDAPEATRPASDSVNPDGEPYPAGEAARGATRDA